MLTSSKGLIHSLAHCWTAWSSNGLGAPCMHMDDAVGDMLGSLLMGASIDELYVGGVCCLRCIGNPSAERCELAAGDWAMSKLPWGDCWRCIPSLVRQRSCCRAAVFSTNLSPLLSSITPRRMSRSWVSDWALDSGCNRSPGQPLPSIMRR